MSPPPLSPDRRIPPSASAPTRLLLLTEFFYDFSTFRLTLESLAGIYAGRGHRVATAGRSDPRVPRAAVAGASWEKTYRIGSSSRKLPALLAGADAVHLHTAGSWSPILSNLADARSDRPLVVTFQDWENPELPANDARARPAWTRLIKRASAVTAVSRGLAERLGRALPSVARRLLVIPNGVDDTLFHKTTAPARASRRPFILCPARLAAYKGIDVLLMAWKDVGPELDSVELVFCGPDHSQGRFQRLARLLGLSSRTRFIGAVGRKKMSELMRDCLFVVLPSRRESFGIVALEAMASAKAVLATRTDGPSDLVSHESTGLLVEPGRVEPLRDGLLLLGKNARLRERLGRAGLERAPGFRWERVADSYLPLYAAARAQ